jgi:hypothetical protein
MDNSTGVRVLFTGQHWPGANSLYIARAFERCGAVVRFLNETAILPHWESKPARAFRRLLWPLIENEWNRQLLDLVHTFQPDLVYITNANFCLPQTIAHIRRKKIPAMCFYHDVRWQGRYGGRFSQNIPGFDLIATTRSWQAPLFEAAGARSVMVTRFGCDPAVHRPLDLVPLAFERYAADVTFIGSREDHRQADLESLVAGDFPFSFRLWGGSWDQIPRSSNLRLYWQKRPVYEQEIPVIYTASKVALHWVGWDPYGQDSAMQIGDQHNSRTFQIPACGGALMLAQRTGEHLHFFEEDKEAVFFSDTLELRLQLAYWLAPQHEAQRQQVVQAARQRCLAEDYSWTPVVRQFLQYFNLPSV